MQIITNIGCQATNIGNLTTYVSSPFSKQSNSFFPKILILKNCQNYTGYYLRIKLREILNKDKIEKNRKKRDYMRTRFRDK